MALTNSRPLQIPALENEILHNTASPVFQASSLVFNPKHDELSRPGSYVTIPNTPSSEASPFDNGSSKSKKDTSSSTPKKESPTLEISKIIPVTGERPMPKERNAPLDDDVLYAVFVILWEKDADLQGMTVKQLSDHLLEKHPEMTNLSTKLSNLISAKLNAYVKKLEKGEKTLTYALSREWSNSSPRRMVYVYRGILSPDYKKHAQAAAVQLKQQQSSSAKSNISGNDINPNLKKSNSNVTDSSFNDFKNSSKSLGVTNLGFSLSPEFNIPYSTSPVSAILTPNSVGTDGVSNNAGLEDAPTSKKRANSDDDSSSGDMNNVKKLKSNSAKPTDNHTVTGDPASSNTKANSTATTTYITAAAAAPRLSKFSSKNGFKSNTQSAAGIMAAIHKVISTQTPIETKCKPMNSNGASSMSGFATLNSADTANSDITTKIVVDAWVKTVREGFLTHDIEPPETLSLEELEYIFD